MELAVGNTRIPYSVRWSDRAKRRRIEVTPEGVVLVVPKGGELVDAEKFLRSRRHWVFEQTMAVGAKVAHRDAYRPDRLVTGAKIYYRGCRMRLTVRKGKRDEIQVRYRNGFLLLTPPDTTERDKRRAMTGWLKQRVREDLEFFVRVYSKKLDLTPATVRVKTLQAMWGSCGSGGILHFDWRLIFAPKAVLEYAALHEVCHLTERTHSPAFWALVRAQMPDFEERKAWLDAHQHLLDALPV